MANYLTMTDEFGQPLFTCEVNLALTIDADQANADLINQALNSNTYVGMQIVGNAVNSTSNTMVMNTNINLQQYEPNVEESVAGTITISVI